MKKGHYKSICQFKFLKLLFNSFMQEQKETSYTFNFTKLKCLYKLLAMLPRYALYFMRYLIIIKAT